MITCFKSLFPLWIVSQLFTKSVPLESECLEDRITIHSRAETTEEEVTEMTVQRVVWPWRRFIRELADWEDALPKVSLCGTACLAGDSGTAEERSPIHAVRKRVNSSLEGVWW